MNDSNKKSNDTFLQKFKGKTNRIDKHDPLAAQKQTFNVREHISNKRKNQNQNNDFSLKQKLFQLEANIQKTRQSKYLDPIAAKISVRSKIQSSKIDTLPPILPVKPPTGVKKNNMSFDQVSHPPSRSVSDKSEGSHHRIFGKYLKLDQQALKHFEFLLQIDKKRQMRKNSAIFSDG